MQVGYKNKIRTYQSEIPNMGTIRGLIDSQLLINYIESLASQVDIRREIMDHDFFASFSRLISLCSIFSRILIFVNIAFLLYKVPLLYYVRVFLAFSRPPTHPGPVGNSKYFDISTPNIT